MSENPYRVSEAALAEPARPAVLPSRGEFGSENGSSLTIGARRLFSAKWIAANAVPSVLTLLAWSLLLIPLVGWMMRVRHPLLDFPLFPLLTSVVVVLFAPLRYAGFPPLTGPAGATPCELAFEPRLPGSAGELRDKADDLGYVTLDGAFLVFAGDRTSLRVHRSDVESVRNRFTLNGLFLGWSPELEVVLAVPLAARRRLRLVRRDTWRTPLAPLRSARLRREIRAWFSGDR